MHPHASGDFQIARGLKLFLILIGAVAVVFGGASVLFGSGIIPNAPGAGYPNVESELRFYAAWYVAGGVLLLRAASDVEREGKTVRLVSAAFFLGAVGRLIAMLTTAAPSTQFVALMVAEFLLPLVIVPWQAKVAAK